MLAATAILLGCQDSADSSGEANEAESPLQTTAEPLSQPETPPAARLPEGIAPTHYTLHLNIDPRQERFTGSVTIDIELDAASSFLFG